MGENLGGGIYEDLFSGGMDVDSSGNCYISGYFESPTAYFGSYTLSTNSYSNFTAKYDTDGNFRWAKYGSAGSICANNNGYYASYPGFINRYDDFGTLLWSKTVNGAANNAMASTFGSVYITGSFNGFVNFDTYSLSSTSDQMFVAKLSDPISTLSVNELSSDLSLNIFPNPSNGILQISYLSTQQGCLGLYIIDPTGKTVYEESVNSCQGNYTKILDLGHYAKGIYLVEVISEKSRSVKRVVVN